MKQNYNIDEIVVTNNCFATHRLKYTAGHRKCNTLKEACK